MFRASTQGLKRGEPSGASVSCAQAKSQFGAAHAAAMSVSAVLIIKTVAGTGGILKKALMASRKATDPQVYHAEIFDNDTHYLASRIHFVRNFPMEDR
jgi:hypothetical protein